MIAIDTEKRIDWNAIRAEYIGGWTSYRKLAEKYKVSFTVLKNRAKKEDWPGLRKQAEHRANTKATQKTADAAADNAVIFERMRKKALLKLERELDAVLEQNGTENRHTETWFTEEGKRTVSETTISKLADILALMDKIALNGIGTNEPQLRAIKEILDGVPSAIN